MNLLFFLCLVGYAVRCDDSNNYYVIQMPEEDPPLQKTSRLDVYWNVPTMQCASKKIYFTKLFEKFGIIQNTNDSFRGDKISILYDPGYFPALFETKTNGTRRRNGGVPQEGNLEIHLEAFRTDMKQSIPDKEFSGIGIIDFESWRPVFRQNFGEVISYKMESYKIEREKHWWWPQSWIVEEAKRRFEKAARLFMQNTIAEAKQLRPMAKWGYYGFPYCFNMAPKNMHPSCSKGVPRENDQIDWLWMESTALYPSVYTFKNLTTSQLTQMISGRVQEAARVRRSHTPILPYFWFRYRDGGFLSEADLQASLKTFDQSEASGFIIWGSSNDVNTVDKCQKLLNYVENVMGPAIAKYTKANRHSLESNDVEIVNASMAESTVATTITFTDETTANYSTETNTERLDNIDSTTLRTVIYGTTQDSFIFSGEENTEPTTENDSDELAIVQEILINNNNNKYNKSLVEDTDTVFNKRNESLLMDLLLNIFNNTSIANQLLSIEADKGLNNDNTNFKSTENVFASSADSTSEVTDKPKNKDYSQTTENVHNTVSRDISLETTNKFLETSTYLGSNPIKGQSYNKKKGEAKYVEEFGSSLPSSLKSTENVKVKGTENYSTVNIYNNIETSTYSSLPKHNFNKDDKKGKPKDDIVLLKTTRLITEFEDFITTEEIAVTTFDANNITTEVYDKSVELITDSAHYVDFKTEESSTSYPTVEDYDDLTSKIPSIPSKDRQKGIPNRISIDTTIPTSKTTEMYGRRDKGYSTEQGTTRLVRKDLWKEKAIDKEDSADARTHFSDNLSPGSSSDQVSGSAHISRPKFMFCLVFYFYSVSKCLCDFYGQCT